MLTFPPAVSCGLCSGLCNRAILVPCCKAIACRKCALFSVSKYKKCWREKCAKVLDISDIVNHYELRVEIDSLADGNILNCGLCGEICKKGARMKCCGTRACRSCATKKITSSRSCWSCSELDLTTDSLVNDDILRKAVQHYKDHKILLPDHRKELAVKFRRIEKELTEGEKIELAKKWKVNSLPFKSAPKPETSKFKKFYRNRIKTKKILKAREKSRNDVFKYDKLFLRYNNAESSNKSTRASGGSGILDWRGKVIGNTRQWGSGYLRPVVDKTQWDQVSGQSSYEKYAAGYRNDRTRLGGASTTCAKNFERGKF